jgi:hypothetical protein
MLSNPFSAFFAALKAATASLNDFAANVNGVVAQMRGEDDTLPTLPDPVNGRKRVGTKTGGGE